MRGMDKYIPILFCMAGTVFTNFISAQSELSIFIKGKIVDQLGNFLPYVNIVVIGKNQGTVSDAAGLFVLELDRENVHDSIQFSSIGYSSKTFMVEHFLKNDLPFHVIVLNSEYESLKEVIVTSKQWRTRTSGNTSRSKFVSGGFSSNDLGAEAGTRIKLNKTPSYLDKISFHISYNKLDSIKVRLNIYAIKNGKPAENILPENIIIDLGNKQAGNIEIDLSKFDLVLSNDILVALQMIEARGDFRSCIFVSAAFLGPPTYYREASDAKWKVYKGLSIGINATVRQ